MKSVLTFIALVLLVGCSASSPDTNAIEGTGNWGLVTNGLKCRVTTDRQEYRISEPVRVLVEVVNSGTRAVSFGRAEVWLSAGQGGFGSGTSHEYPQKEESGYPVTLQPDSRWEKTLIIHPWGPTYSSSPAVAAPGSMTLEAIFVYRPDSSSKAKFVKSSVVTFEAKK
jgi:hypothetical protein